MGDKFFILEEGEAIAEKVFVPGSSPTKVKEYSKGQYFGELALIKNAPRAASVKAIVSILNNRRQIVDC
jgi:cAMP-dependent protein kinase regulator